MAPESRRCAALLYRFGRDIAARSRLGGVSCRGIVKYTSARTAGDPIQSRKTSAEYAATTCRSDWLGGAAWHQETSWIEYNRMDAARHQNPGELESGRRLPRRRHDLSVRPAAARLWPCCGRESRTARSTAPASIKRTVAGGHRNRTCKHSRCRAAARAQGSRDIARLDGPRHWRTSRVDQLEPRSSTEGPDRCVASSDLLRCEHGVRLARPGRPAVTRARPDHHAGGRMLVSSTGTPAPHCPGARVGRDPTIPLHPPGCIRS